MAVRLVDAIKYILSKEGCVHPFRLSRILALAEIEYYKDKGSRLTDATYVMGPGVFYIEGFKEIVESDPCLEKKKGDPQKGTKGCIHIVCGETPRLPGEAAGYLDRAIEKARGLDDLELNSLVVNNENFKKLAKKEGE